MGFKPTSNADLALTEVPEVTITETTTTGTGDEAGRPDPMTTIDGLPEVTVPVACLAAGFHLRQDGIDACHVRLLADAAESAPLPAILVQKSSSRVIDGMHRVHAARMRGEHGISARLVDCTDAEALVLAVKLNTLHGLPLSRDDRISGAKRILAAHADWSDRAVAHVAGLSAKTIASLRTISTGSAQVSGKRVGRDGRRRPVLAAEGRRRAAEYISEHPDASLRQVARETDVSLGTVHDVRERLRQGGELPATAGQTRPAGAGPATADVPAGVRSLHSVGASRHCQRLLWTAIAAKLSGDPALKYTDGGRAFLRWMSGHSTQADEWREFIDAIPCYWLADVSRIAASMSEEWRLFAEQIGSKIDQMETAS